MLVGLHGVGKSAVIEQWCKENNIYLETILVSKNDHYKSLFEIFSTNQNKKQ
jgi:hypothetical protein